MRNPAEVHIYKYVHVVEPNVQISLHIFSVIALETICTQALRPLGKNRFYFEFYLNE